MAGIYVNIAPIHGDQKSGFQSPAGYERALAAELNHYATSHTADASVESIYLGGLVDRFRPDLFPPIMETLSDNFDTGKLREITLEILPGRITRGDYARFLAMGVTRFQVLAGSFFDEDLKELHTPFESRQVIEAFDEARATGLDRMAIDLCLDVPNQPYEYWGANLEKLVQLKIDHVSFHRRAPVLDSDWPQPHNRYFRSIPLTDVEMARYKLAAEYLSNAGYRHYLWMEFARPAMESVHSRHYVRHTNVLGAGAGAHSFRWHGSSRTRAARWANVEGAARYTALLAQKELPIDSKSWIDLDALGDEYTMLQLQTDEGLDALYLEKAYGIDLFSEKIDELAHLETMRWIEPIRNNRVRLTRLGMLNYPLVFNRLLLKD